MSIDKDFSRNVWCFLGLPFDTVDMQQAVTEIISAIEQRKSCFLSTPNLNFLCGAQTDPVFRQSVINSDLSVADGFPIVFFANLLNIPVPERVAGSDLINRLYHRQTDKPVNVFFFGGPEGAGERACQKINETPSGLKCVGHFGPGFGSIPEMSTPDIIEKLNSHDIDFLILALGAKKGQAWIEKNRALLKAPVISHLGAVINFFAGTVSRAPESIQKIGLEWLWRIYQEPSLWRRYYDDAKVFFSLFLTRILPYWIWLTFNKQTSIEQELAINTKITDDNVKHILLTGLCNHVTIAPLRNEFKTSATENRNVVIDLAKVNLADSAFFGLCLILYKYLKASGHTLRFINPNNSVKRIMTWQKMDDYLD